MCKPWAPQYTKEMSNVIVKLLNKDKKERLGARRGAEEILKDPWFADIDIKSILAKTAKAPLIP